VRFRAPVSAAPPDRRPLPEEGVVRHQGPGVCGRVRVRVARFPIARLCPGGCLARAPSFSRLLHLPRQQAPGTLVTRIVCVCAATCILALGCPAMSHGAVSGLATSPCRRPDSAARHAAFPGRRGPRGPLGMTRRKHRRLPQAGCLLAPEVLNCLAALCHDQTHNISRVTTNPQHITSLQVCRTCALVRELICCKQKQMHIRRLCGEPTCNWSAFGVALGFGIALTKTPVMRL